MRSILRKFISRRLYFIFPIIRSIDLYFASLFGRIHESDYRALKYLIRPKAKVIDIGANLGQSVTSLSEVLVSPSIYSFECNPSCFDTLNLVAKINSFLRGSRAKVFEYGLSNKEEQLIFKVPVFKRVEYLQEGFSKNIHPDLDKISSRIGALQNEISMKEHAVFFKTLDSFGFTPDLIKIDVQGAELQVLKGAYHTIKNFKPILFIEVPDNIEVENDLTSYLSEKLFYVYYKLSNNFICFPFKSNLR